MNWQVRVMMLNTREWKPFIIDDIFITDKGMYLNKKNILNGDIPYITAKSFDNGVNDFIGNQPLFTKDSVTIEKIKLSAYYQPHNFYCSHDVSVIQNENLNKHTSLFVCTMIKRQGVKYSYGRQAQLNVVKREVVFLPIDENNKPDWKFMEDYIIELEDRKKAEYNKYLGNGLKKIEYKKIDELSDKEWKTFNLTDIFSQIQRGKRLIKSKQKEGNIPYVSSTSYNNGVDNFISNKKNVRMFSNCLSIANSGSVGASFYEPFTFVASDHITHLKNDKMNKYIYLFIATMTNRLSEKYNFNREINDNRISREKIMLPINAKEEPDYIYMEQYIKNLMVKKYNQYKEHLQKSSLK